MLIKHDPLQVNTMTCINQKFTPSSPSNTHLGLYLAIIRMVLTKLTLPFTALFPR